ncbi:MAG TPA: sulfide/dihydroorotate dehydrogenase-like FAD/NAD-binding protein [Firmicutes bacterium]|nr:sulfide/dihydroorotate dehydrogenase-like FAD/NAD-binding protein [Bacillota bacterium]
MFPILKKRLLTPVTVLFEIAAPLVCRRAQPGQFVIVRLGEKSERIPLTIMEAGSDGILTIVIQAVGKSTREMLALKEGDALADVVGPLGQPCPLRDSGHVVLVGGGFGVAPIIPIARALHERGVEVTAINGARTAELLILEEELQGVSDHYLVCTNDGSKGTPGMVTDVLKTLIAEGRHIDEVIAIGPMVMMRAVTELTRPHGLRTLVSLDPIMVDGTGMCGVCRVSVGGQTRFACVDGPIFDAHQVDFELAVRRGHMYEEEQRKAVEHYERCRCHQGGEA